MTLSLVAVVDAAVDRLVAAGWTTGDARVDVGVLARTLLGWDTAAWLARQRERAPDDFPARLKAVVDRRSRHEPVAYITGEREFFGRPFRVTPAVLIPRPETELLVEEALWWIGARPARVIDIGTGSGCIATTIACERPDLTVTATDVSKDALAVARENARTLGVDDRVRFVEGSLFAGLDDSWDVVLSNPPYIALTDKPTLASDVRDFEPSIALFGGPDGLVIIRALIDEAKARLAPGGVLMMEIGAGQDGAVVEILEASGQFESPRTTADLQGIPRAVIARRR